MSDEGIVERWIDRVEVVDAIGHESAELDARATDQTLRRAGACLPVERARRKGGGDEHTPRKTIPPFHVSSGISCANANEPSRAGLLDLRPLSDRLVARDHANRSRVQHTLNEMPVGDDSTVQQLLRFTRSVHEAGGYPANELEPRIVELASALGLHSVQASATPTWLA